jgi:hypothetical protein
MKSHCFPVQHHHQRRRNRSRVVYVKLHVKWHVKLEAELAAGNPLLVTPYLKRLGIG